MLLDQNKTGGMETVTQGGASTRGPTGAGGQERTFPQLLLEHARTRPEAPALREKYLGIWQTLSWSKLCEQVFALAGGLAARGVRRGDHVALIGDKRPNLYASMIATQCLGGIPVPMYQDAVAAEMVYVFRDASIRVAVVEDQEQTDKLLEIRNQCPELAAILYDDERGLRHYFQDGVESLHALVAAGRDYNQAHPGAVLQHIEAGRFHDDCAMFYTSGTTGNPKGVVHTHASLIVPSRTVSQQEGLGPGDEVLAYLPMAWIGQNIFSYAQWLINGFTINMPESQDTVMIDMREVGPSYYFAPPRVLEALLTTVTIRMEDAAAFKRGLFRHYMEIAREIGGRILDRDPSVSLWERMQYQLGDWFIYGPLRNALGMSRVRLAYTAGEAIGPDLFIFYRSLGINLKQLYGSTETAVWVCVQPDGQVRADTVGKPVEGVEVRVIDNGEILVRSPGLLREYYKNPRATAEVKDDAGWYRTGDAGYFDQEGHLRIIDRAKDVGQLADGSLFAPKYLENKLKFFPYIKEAVAFGQGKSEVCCFVNIDFEACGNWAERRNLPYAGYYDLACKPEIVELIRGCVDQTNADLAQDPKLASSQISRFLILHKELDPDDDELTRTRKVRRGFIAQKYAVLVEAMFAGKDAQYVETQVKFEDGRMGSVRATVSIAQATRYGAPASRHSALAAAA